MKPKQNEVSSPGAAVRATILLRTLLLGLKNRTLKEVSACKAGITRLDFGVLHMLSEHPEPSTITELSEAMGVEPPTLVASVTRLEHKKLLTKRRDPNDRRRMPLMITPSGSVLHKKIVASSERLMADTFSKMGTQRAKQFLELLEEVVENYT